MNDEIRAALLTGNIGPLLASAAPDEIYTMDMVGVVSGGGKYRFGATVISTVSDRDENAVDVCVYDDAADAAASMTHSVHMITMVHGMAVATGMTDRDSLIISHTLAGVEVAPAESDLIQPTMFDMTV
jgi:hypothetical protein